MAQTNLPQPPAGNGSLDRWLFLLWKKITATASIVWTQITLPTEAANKVLAGPTTGADAQVTFRALVNADIPSALDSKTIGGTTPGAGTFTTLASTGNSTWGDAAADTLTINAGILGANLSLTRTSGTVAAGAVNSILLTNTFTGDSGGTTSIGGFVTSITGSGANAVNAQTGNQTTSVWGGSVTASTVTGNLAIVRTSSSGAVTALRGHTADMRINGSGNVSVITGFQTITPNFSSTGVASFMRGFATSDIGHATLVTNALSFDAASNTASATLTANYRAQQNSGTGCWAFLSVGTASSAHAGSFRFGSLVAPTATVDITGSLAVSGDATIGDAAGDTLTLNAGVITLPAFVATRTAGTVATGTVLQESYLLTYTGDAGGATTLRGYEFSTKGEGANAVNNQSGIRSVNEWNGTNTLVGGNAIQAVVNITNSGAATTARGYSSSITLSSSGNVTTGNGYIALSPTLSSTGTITSNIGYSCADQGHATLVGTAVGFSCNDFTASATAAYAFRSSMNSGTGKWAFASLGTADSAHAGKFRFGSGTVAPVNTVDITGSLGRGAPVTKTADFTVAATENWLINNKSGSSCTVTLPTASSWTGRELMLQNYQTQTVISASSNVVPLGGGAAGTAILAATAGKWATLVSDGTNWIIMAAA